MLDIQSSHVASVVSMEANQSTQVTSSTLSYDPIIQGRKVERKTWTQLPMRANNRTEQTRDISSSGVTIGTIMITIPPGSYDGRVTTEDVHDLDELSPAAAPIMQKDVAFCLDLHSPPNATQRDKQVFAMIVICTLSFRRDTVMAIIDWTNVLSCLRSNNINVENEVLERFLVGIPSSECFAETAEPIESIQDFEVSTTLNLSIYIYIYYNIGWLTVQYRLYWTKKAILVEAQPSPI